MKTKTKKKIILKCRIRMHFLEHQNIKNFQFWLKRKKKFVKDCFFNFFVSYGKDIVYFYTI